jgi:hypothetical protein
MAKKPRTRFKKGTVIDEWKDETGQWWQSTVVKDTKTVFKSITRKIDKPTRVPDEERHERD